jgi:hypothetical protein
MLHGFFFYGDIMTNNPAPESIYSPEYLAQIRATALAHAVSIGTPSFEEDTLSSAQKATIVIGVASKFEKYILGTTE